MANPKIPKSRLSLRSHHHHHALFTFAGQCAFGTFPCYWKPATVAAAIAQHSPEYAGYRASPIAIYVGHIMPHSTHHITQEVLAGHCASSFDTDIVLTDFQKESDQPHFKPRDIHRHYSGALHNGTYIVFRAGHRNHCPQKTLGAPHYQHHQTLIRPKEGTITLQGASLRGQGQDARL
jgi:hypothetical protein